MSSISFTFYVIVLLVGVYEINGILSQNYGLPPLMNSKPRNVAKWGTINQFVDNFNAQDNRTYQMRFLYNNELYKPGGPIFIYLGGEWNITKDKIEGGLLFDIARKHNGFLFYTEHRYFGYSQPLVDWSTENLAYLSIDQALADVANFIAFVRDTFNLPNNKVVVAGASYSATMATWMRLKYPHLVDAAWASSALVVAELNFPKYQEIVGDNIKLYSPQCYQIIEQASAKIASLIETREGREKLQRDFKMCMPVKNEFPYSEFFWLQVVQTMSNVVQYSTPEVITNMCNIIINANSIDPMEKLAYWIRHRQNKSCIMDYDLYLKAFGSPVINLSKIERQWRYLMCTQFGWFATTTSGNQPYGINHITPNLFIRMCNDLFGPTLGLKRLSGAPARTNNRFGGRNKALTKVVSIHGSIDPWQWQGILEDLHADAPARLVPGTSHNADMTSIDPAKDNKQMIAAKQLVMDSIARWIQ